ncbi:hypothetical protein [Methylomagnum sp.]
MIPTPPLRCLFYSHVWCAQLLGSMPWLAPESLLIELAEHSHLAPMVKQHGRDRPGLAPLLVPPVQRAWFRRGTKWPLPSIERALAPIQLRGPGRPVPLLVAAHPPLPLPAIESAIALLRQAECRFEEMVLLVHILDAPRFAAIFPQADSFRVLWDIADLPSAALPDLMRVLSGPLREAPCRWQGFSLCNHPGRVPVDGAERWTLWRELLAEFPAIGSDNEAG